MTNIFAFSAGLTPNDSADFAPDLNTHYFSAGLTPLDGAAPTPEVNTITPKFCTHTNGCEVILTGLNFGIQQGDGKVFFGTREASAYTSWADDQIVCTTPIITDSLVDILSDIKVTRQGATFTIIEETFRFYFEGHTLERIEASVLASESALANTIVIDDIVDQILPLVANIYNKLPAGQISDLNLGTVFDGGVTLEDLYNVLLAMAKGTFKKDVPGPGQITFYKQDGVTPITIVTITETARLLNL